MYGTMLLRSCNCRLRQPSPCSEAIGAGMISGIAVKKNLIAIFLDGQCKLNCSIALNRLKRDSQRKVYTFRSYSSTSILQKRWLQSGCVVIHLMYILKCQGNLSNQQLHVYASLKKISKTTYFHGYHNKQFELN